MYTYAKMLHLLRLARARKPAVEPSDLAVGAILRTKAGTGARVVRVVERGVWVRFWRDGVGWQTTAHYIDRCDMALYAVEGVPTCEHGPACECPDCSACRFDSAVAAGTWRRH